MADDQRPDADTREDSETPRPRRGLGRFASRFRREREPDQAGIDASPAPEDEHDDAPWLVPTSPERPPRQDPESLAPELDLSRIPPAEREAEAEVQSPSEEPESEPVSEQIGPPALAGEPEPERIEASAEADSQPMSGNPLPTAGGVSPPALESAEPASAPTSPSAPDPQRTPALTPVLVATEPEIEEIPQGDDEPLAGPRTRPAGISAHLAVLTAVATSIIMAFLLIEPSPRWLLLLGAAAVVFGLDGTLRQTWRAPFSLGQETAPFLFVPALYMMAVPVLIEHNVSGELVFLVGLGAGFGFGALAWAETASVRPQAPEYEQARVIATANTYLTGFAIFSLSYVFEVGLPAAIAATSIAAAMLAVEVLREGEIDPMETLGLSLVTGIILGEARWLLYYVPLDTYLAGLTLLLVFYLATGLLHSHVIRALNRVVAVEYGGIAAAGLALVILARAVGLA